MLRIWRHGPLSPLSPPPLARPPSPASSCSGSGGSPARAGGGSSRWWAAERVAPACGGRSAVAVGSGGRRGSVGGGRAARAVMVPGDWAVERRRRRPAISCPCRWRTTHSPPDHRRLSEATCARLHPPQHFLPAFLVRRTGCQVWLRVPLLAPGIADVAPNIQFLATRLNA